MLESAGDVSGGYFTKIVDIVVRWGMDTPYSSNNLNNSSSGDGSPRMADSSGDRRYEWLR